MINFDRYKNVRGNGMISKLPFGKINKNNTDYIEVYKKGTTRLDLLSFQYYETPNFGWLILQANPQYGSMEFQIPDQAELRIPYPLNNALESYDNSITRFIDLYGF